MNTTLSQTCAQVLSTPVSCWILVTEMKEKVQKMKLFCLEKKGEKTQCYEIKVIMLKVLHRLSEKAFFFFLTGVKTHFPHKCLQPTVVQT